MKITDILDSIISKTNANTEGSNIYNANPKTALADADELPILDSANSFSLKKLTWANLRNSLALTGTPTAPTAPAGTDNTTIATTNFVRTNALLDVQYRTLDFNTVKTAGVYHVNAGASTNMPHVFNGMLEVLRYNDSYVIQRYSTWNNRFFERALLNGAWNSWREIVLASTWNDWQYRDTLANVAGLLCWKNYGNGHVIFDASAGTAPNGAAVNNTNPQGPWEATRPTLMGWNGSATFGVRVDSARVADNGTSTASFSGNGYQRFNNGLIIQWGKVIGGTNGGTYTYPIAFPAAVVLVITGGTHGTTSTAGSAHYLPDTYDQTTTSFKAAGYNNAGSTFSWLAIGY